MNNEITGNLMNLEEKINSEIKLAMTSKDKLRLETLRSIRAGILEFLKSGEGMVMNDEAEFKILNSNAKKRKDAIEIYEKAGRTEAADKEKAELEIIMEFLPKQLTDSEIADFVKSAIEKTGASGMQDMGKVMGLAMKELKGKADGNKVQAIVKDLLG